MTLSIEKIKERFSDRTDICLVDYKGWSIPSVFYDLVVNKEFISRPDNVFYQKSRHPERSKNIKITEEEAKRKLKTNNPDLELVEFNGWSKKCKFYDVVVKKTFNCFLQNVFKRKMIHPDRTGNFWNINEEKAKEILKYRTDLELVEFCGWSKKCKFYDKTANASWWIAPSVLHFQKTTSHPSLTKEKAQKTKKIFGSIVGFHKAREIINRNDIDLVEGFYNGWSQKKSKFVDLVLNEEFWAIPEKLNREKCVHPKRAIENKTKYFISETKESLVNFLASCSDPKPSYSSLIQTFSKTNTTNISTKEITEILKNYEEHKTQIEILGERLFQSKHYNQVPDELKTGTNVGSYRPDFRLSPNVFINVDGLYWHSEKEKSTNYHFSMRKKFEENNLRLFQFYENEVRNTPKIIKSIVANALGNTPKKIFARKCEIKPVIQSLAQEFLINNHLMGSLRAKHLGLYFKDELVSILSYKVKKHVCKIERFCSQLEVVLIGGFSKLLKHLEKTLGNIVVVNEIHYWTDLRYGTGNHLENKGFVLKKETLGWKWTNYKEIFNRLKCKANMDTRGLSQADHAAELKWSKIYDAGQRLYVKPLPYI